MMTPMNDSTQSEAHRLLQPLAERLVELDGHQRQEALAGLLRVASPGYLRLLADRLLELARQERGGRRTRALAAVREVGEPAVLPLKLASLGRCDAGLRLQMIEALADVGLKAQPHQEAEVMMHLILVGGVARSKKVRAAVDEPVARMR